MKKTALWTALLIGTSLSTNAVAEVIDSGTCGDDCYWEYDDDTAELNVFGKGAMTDYGQSNLTRSPWSNYPVETINIEEGITSIGNNAFYSMDDVTEVNLPNGLQSIGEYAFWSCDELTRIVIPDTVGNVGNGAMAFYLAGAPNQAVAIYCPPSVCKFDGSVDSQYVYDYEKDENGFYYSIDDDEYFLSSQDMLNGDSCGELQECQATALENKGLCEWDDCYAFLDSYEAGDQIRMNGKNYASLSDLFAGKYIVKRIYTVEEAAAVSKETGNTFKLRYK